MSPFLRAIFLHFFFIIVERIRCAKRQKQQAILVEMKFKQNKSTHWNSKLLVDIWTNFIPNSIDQGNFVCQTMLFEAHQLANWFLCWPFFFAWRMFLPGILEKKEISTKRQSKHSKRVMEKKQMDFEFCKKKKYLA